MAIVGRVEIRPVSTTSYETYTALACRCLLCGTRKTHFCNKPNRADYPFIVRFCDCYSEQLQPIRMIPNDREAGPLVLSTKAI